MRLPSPPRYSKIIHLPIGVNADNSTDEDRTVYVKAEGVEVRIASGTEEDRKYDVIPMVLVNERTLGFLRLYCILCSIIRILTKLQIPWYSAHRKLLLFGKAEKTPADADTAGTGQFWYDTLYAHGSNLVEPYLE